MSAPAAETVILTPSQIGRLSECGECWQARGRMCAPEGSHLARYRRSVRKGLLPDAWIRALVCLMGDSPATLIPDHVADSVPDEQAASMTEYATTDTIEDDTAEPHLSAWPDLEEGQ